jgi:hypothetical protein
MLNVVPVGATPPTRRAAASSDGLRLIASGMVYLLVVCVVVIVTSVLSVLQGEASVPGRVFDDRDLVALFGWVGMMITGVSVIIIPNHLGVRLRPLFLPRLHFALANIGLVGFFSTSLLAPGTSAPTGFLALVAVSFLTFGLAVLFTVAPFLRSLAERRKAESVEAAGHRATN